jgi:nicotinate-nucleotide adenylyltransferase
MRIALFGGTFDPIHRGHLAIATAAADAFALDLVLFAPAGRQPLKPDGTPTAFADRVAMTGLACAVDRRFTVSELDAPRDDGSPNYTVDTVATLQREMPAAKLFVLVGADSFLDLPRWHEAERLLQSVEWIVVSRPGFVLPESLLEELPGGAFKAATRERIHVLHSIHEDVSATELRERLHNGEDCSDLLPAAVMRYIREHRLYGLDGVV